MKKFILDLTVSSLDRINEKYFLLKLHSDESLPEMLPGQFVEVRVDGSPSTFLRRPFGINNVDYAHNELWMLIAVQGEGTRHLSELKTGDTVNCLLPLGNGFTMPDEKNKRLLLVGGGAGVAPLLFFGKRLHEMGCEPTFLIGVRNKSDFLELDLFKQFGRVFVTTEDGSYGEKGFVTDHSILNNEHFDQISTCGPKPMMMAVARYARKAGIACEASLENMMACGLGACLCCVEKTTLGNLRVCKDGPVFDVNELLWK